MSRRADMGIPPPTFMACPVIYDERSDARNKTALAISSGVPTLSKGTDSPSRSKKASLSFYGE